MIVLFLFFFLKVVCVAEIFTVLLRNSCKQAGYFVNIGYANPVLEEYFPFNEIDTRPKENSV